VGSRHCRLPGNVYLIVLTQTYKNKHEKLLIGFAEYYNDCDGKAVAKFNNGSSDEFVLPHPASLRIGTKFT